MPTARFQPSFAAGVLGPGLHGRIDIAKYDVGLKVGKNAFVHAHGGVSNRAGTEFICEVMDHTKKHRLIPFTRDEDENFIMLMGDLSMKIIDDGAVVQDGGSDYNPSTPYNEASLETIDYVQSIDVMYMAQQSVFPQRMSRTGATSWTFENVPVDPSVAAPSNIGVSKGGSGSETYRYRVSTVTDGVEGFASDIAEVSSAQDLAIDGAKNTISWTDIAGSEFNIYRERNGVYGFIGFTDSNSFVDDNISADLQLTPVIPSQLFSAASDYPAAVTIYQQRLVFANSQNQPETMWMSRTGDFTNMTRSRILKDTDRIILDLSGEKINRIYSMLQLRELLVFASSGEFSVTGPNGVMLATSPQQTQYGYSGAVKVKPLVVEDTALFVDRTGRSVRDLRYAFEQDGYTGNDLTIFASHYFEGKQVKGWAYAKSPFSVIWVYLDDGTLLSFTYKREHQVWAWCEHDLGGEVESVAVVPEGTEDAVYLIVKREIGGATKRYVERIHSRNFEKVEDCFFVDCGLTYSGAAATTITGLDHLEGEDVVALSDGNVVEGLTVTGGSVTLPKAATPVHVGLPCIAEIENLPPAIDLEDVGSARGRPIKASSLKIQLEKTRGIEVGTQRDRMTQMVQTGVDLARDIPLFTGMLELQLYPAFNRDGTVIIRQTYPLPMTVLGISPELTVGR